MSDSTLPQSIDSRIKAPFAYSDARRGARAAQLASLVRYKLGSVEAIAAAKARAFVRMRDAAREGLGEELHGLSVVDVGAGQWMSNARLFAASGARVLAVDPELPPSGIGGYAEFARALGLQRAAKTLANDVVLGRRFERALAAGAGVSEARLAAAKPDRYRGGAERLPLADGSVDVVVSDNVYEHVPDVRAVTAEIARVLRPGGVACITIHPFSAFSGGHHPATIHHGDGPFSPTIPAWDHLRGERFPSGVFLNRVRIRDYRTILGSHLETVTWEEHVEGEAWLDDEVLRDLPGYSREELSVGKIFYVGRKAG